MDCFYSFVVIDVWSEAQKAYKERNNQGHTGQFLTSYRLSRLLKSVLRSSLTLPDQLRGIELEPLYLSSAVPFEFKIPKFEVDASVLTKIKLPYELSARPTIYEQSLLSLPCCLRSWIYSLCLLCVLLDMFIRQCLFVPLGRTVHQSPRQDWLHWSIPLQAHTRPLFSNLVYLLTCHR